jgi:hypothetical protein
MLVLDECHLASDITLDYAGASFNNIQRVDINLPQFPVIKGATRADMMRAEDWIVRARGVMYEEWKRLKAQLKDGPNKKLSRRASALQNHDYSLAATLIALRECPEAWYIRSGPFVGTHRGKKVTGIIIRPLTAKYHFPRLFLQGEWKVMLMSATVGDFKTFAKELGISMSKCMVRRVPSNFPPETRPIHVLDAPKLNWKSKEKDYLRQAEVIAEAIGECPPEWSGLIHVTRKSEAPLLRERLVKYGIDENRIWIPPQRDRHRRWMGTQRQVEDWERFLHARRDAIAISWMMQEGYDGVDIDMVFTAKVPFPSCLPGSYEEARMKYSRGFYDLRTAWMLQQQQGRNRRGREGDYDRDGVAVKYNAVADGNVLNKRVQKNLDPDFLEALVQ